MIYHGVVEALKVRADRAIIDDTEAVGKFTAVDVAPGVSVTEPTLFERPSTSSFVVETMA
jgi:hypothetical protein